VHSMKHLICALSNPGDSASVAGGGGGILASLVISQLLDVELILTPQPYKFFSIYKILKNSCGGGGIRTHEPVLGARISNPLHWTTMRLLLRCTISHNVLAKQGCYPTPPNIVQGSFSHTFTKISTSFKPEKLFWERFFVYFLLK
jgi:hypothetical protein